MIAWGLCRVVKRGDFGRGGEQESDLDGEERCLKENFDPRGHAV